MHVILLITDGTSVLIIKENNRQIQLPNTLKYWPIEWQKRTHKQVAQKLARHITFGVLSGKECEPLALEKVFGLEEKCTCMIFRMSFTAYQQLLEILDRVLYHAHYIAKCECPSVVSMTIENILASKTCTVETIHCVRAYFESQQNK